MRLSDLQLKKIVSISTGRNIGSIVDINIGDNGLIDSLIVDQGRSFFSFSKDGDFLIKWNDITKIGEDVILVKRD